jgi:fatty acid desaturase
MDHNPSSVSPFRIPSIVWVLIAAAIAAGAAIFIFKVAIGSVLTYGFFGFMILSHFFMHGSHGSHGNHSDNDAAQSGDNTEPKSKDQQGH